MSEAERERWAVRLAFAALVISLFALGVTYLQWRSAERAADIANQARIDANTSSAAALAVAERARVDAVNLAERQRADAQMTLSTQRKDAATALEAQTKRADQANVLADRSAKAAEATAKTAAVQVEVSERPWIKIKPTLVSPLIFNSPAQAGAVANASVRLELENTGNTVALNILTWTDILPLDPGSGWRGALKRRSEWCDANRHPNQQVLGGYYLFPNEPFVEVHSVGPPMNRVLDAARDNIEGLKGKVGFVLVGCVSYRAPLQTQDQPSHETLFMYFLGRTDRVGLNPYVEPSGSVDLQLVAMPDGFSAD
jgi:hypothetical protein